MKKISIASGARTTRPGYVNGNRQEVVAKSGRSESRAGQSVYRLRCRGCGLAYGSNGIDIEKRLCPGCQGGVKGEMLRELAGPGLFG